MPFLLDDDRDAELFEHFSDPDQNGDEYARLNAIAGEDISQQIGFQVPEGYELRMVKHPNAVTELEVFMLNHKTERVAYFNRVEKLDLHLDKVGDDKPVSQVMIWRAVGRTGDGKATRDLVQAVFFNMLVDSYNIVVSDSEQTRDGHRMWEGLLLEAMESDELIAAAGDISNGHLYIIETEKQLNAQKKWLWGQKDFHRERVGVIAST
ncbi:hypothetical protein [Pontibacterium sp.]|uniref:hypothetical protein n=1 Tax=Pontibacterium sp. TaxID=2036026 RepID=UPI0035656648